MQRSKEDKRARLEHISRTKKTRHIYVLGVSPCVGYPYRCESWRYFSGSYAIYWDHHYYVIVPIFPSFWAKALLIRRVGVPVVLLRSHGWFLMAGIFELWDRGIYVGKKNTSQAFLWLLIRCGWDVARWFPISVCRVQWGLAPLGLLSALPHTKVLLRFH